MSAVKANRAAIKAAAQRRSIWHLCMSSKPPQRKKVVKNGT